MESDRIQGTWWNLDNGSTTDHSVVFVEPKHRFGSTKTTEWSVVDPFVLPEFFWYRSLTDNPTLITGCTLWLPEVVRLHHWAWYTLSWSDNSACCTGSSSVPWCHKSECYQRKEEHTEIVLFSMLATAISEALEGFISMPFQHVSKPLLFRTLKECLNESDCRNTFPAASTNDMVSLR